MIRKKFNVQSVGRSFGVEKGRERVERAGRLFGRGEIGSITESQVVATHPRRGFGGKLGGKNAGSKNRGML